MIIYVYVCDGDVCMYIYIYACLFDDGYNIWLSKLAIDYVYWLKGMSLISWGYGICGNMGI